MSHPKNQEAIEKGIMGQLATKILVGIFAFVLVVIPILPGNEKTPEIEKAVYVQILEEMKAINDKMGKLGREVQRNQTLLQGYGKRIERGENTMFDHIEGHK